MRFRMGFMMGFGAGYVMGTKAGRQQYERIRSMGSQVMQTPAAEKVKSTFEQITDRITLDDSVSADRQPIQVAGMSRPSGLETLP